MEMNIKVVFGNIVVGIVAGTLCLIFIVMIWAIMITHEPSPEPIMKQYNEQLIDLQQQKRRDEWLIKQVFGTSEINAILSTPIEITAYTAREIECDSTPEVTADMTPSRIGLLAISRDLRSELGIQFGQTVVLEGMGVFKVHDLMNKRYRRRVDILHANPKAAELFGKQKGVLIWII
jgi:3D (Asp-Asp-Asp) domain-containing protein